MKLAIFTILLFLNLPLIAKLPDPVKEFRYEKMKLLQDVLKEDFSANKRLDKTFELQSLIALSFFPELEKQNIRFQQKNIKTTMKSLPRLDFICRKKRNRVYKISIDNQVRNKKGLLLKEVPFNAQIGIIGHELAHIVDYDSKTAAGIVFLGAEYLFHGKRRQIENRVDELTIAHGLGHQVKDFSGFVLNDEEVNERYLRYKRKFYYTPEQLMQIILKYPIY